VRIFKASRDGNIPKLRYLQKKLLGSFDAKLFAVRRVTTLNKGKNTPGVDNKVYVTDEKKMALVKSLRVDGKALPIRRVFIPKPGKKEKRPLGIPIVRDRAKQALVLLALEPEWEARFEPNSYGFRPGRSCQDAIEAIFSSLRNNSADKEYHKYILDADISKCFDQIDHDYLLSKISSLPEVDNQIKSWLKSGIMEGFAENMEYDVPENEVGTPQGGVISPFLSNVALHGMEMHLKEWIVSKPSFAKSNRYSKDAKRKSIAIIRCADDFVVIHKNKGIIMEAKEEISKWLKNGPCLKINEEKTKIVNSNNGFDFLGQTCITIRRGGQPRVKIYPSRKSQERYLANVRDVIQNNRSASTYNLIHTLKPKIIGWANYHKYSECKQVFSKLTHLTNQKLRAWVFRRDTRNSRHNVKEKYFPAGRSYQFDGTKHFDNWVLVGTRKSKGKSDKMDELYLPHIVWVKSRKWVKVKGNASVYDGNNLYWGKRTMNKGTWKTRERKLIKRQNGRCTWCKTVFQFTDIVEVDHVHPKSKGGPDTYDNLQLLHKHCHVKKTATDASLKRYKAVKKTRQSKK
jgi:group II intron reverse transcriptase/maturase